MQLLLLKYREEIIQAKVAKEHIEESLKSQIMFLKDQVVSEQQEKSNMEETLTQEINSLQERLGKDLTLCVFRWEDSGVELVNVSEMIKSSLIL